MNRPAICWRASVILALVFLLCAGMANAATVQVRFWQNDQIAIVNRDVPTGVSPAEAAIRALVAGPTAAEAQAGVKSSIPAGVSIVKLNLTQTAAEVDMSAGVTSGLSEAGLTDIFNQFRMTLGDFPAITDIKLTSKGKSLGSYLSDTGVVGQPAPALVKTNGVGLAGKKICVGPSHGKFWNGSGWYWQRGLTCGWGEAALEDLLSIKLVTLLGQYLTQDGATVVYPRQMNLSDCCHTETGLPWHQMCAQSWLKHAGLPGSVWASASGNYGAETAVNRNSDDIRARPLYADYTNSDIYIAHHTNAGGNGTATGTETYRDTQMAYQQYVGASLNLATAIQNNVVNAIRSTFDEEPSWASRGVKDSAAGFGEIRVPSRPAVLIELAFHDDCTRDALYMTQDDFFKSVAEWGLYKGICEYFGNTPTWDKYSCEYVSDTIPATMNPKQVYNCSITLRNRGVAWYSARGFRLVATGNNDSWFKSVSFINSPNGIKPGETATFNFQLTGPVVGGVRKTEWRMARNGYSAGFGPTITKMVDAGTVVDNDPPSVPTNLHSTAATTTSISLAWNASTDADSEVSGYTVYRNGNAIATITGTTYKDTGLTHGTTYSYEVDAIDAFNHRSAKCAPVQASTVEDGEAPTVPGNLRTTAVTAKNVALAWNASTDNIGVTGYAIYRNGVSIATTASTTYNDTGVAQSSSYTYQVDAYDAAGNRSAKSNAVSVNTPILATWGPYTLTQGGTIYSPSYFNSTYTTGWYTTTAGTGAARTVLKATDTQMATMPAQALINGATFTIQFQRNATYSSSANNPLNIYRITKDWNGGSVLWNTPWASGGGDYASVGTASQACIYPDDGYTFTFNVSGTNGWFPYGVLLKGDNESSITYRKKFITNSGTLAVNYVPPTPTIRTWSYLGHYPQGTANDHATRINTDHVAGTYVGIPINEANIAPCAANGAAGPSYGNSYGTFKWKKGTSENDVCSFLQSSFYNASAVDNGTTYAATYIYNSGAQVTNAYLFIGSDDACKVYLNGALVGSYLAARACIPDLDIYGPVTIKNGWNRLLVKVENGGGGYGLYARVGYINRTAVPNLTAYAADGTLPNNPTSCTESGGAVDNTAQKVVTAPSFSWSGAADPQGSGEGVSGVRGYRVYFGTDPEGAPDAFQTGTTFAPGTQAPGTYYLRVSTVDYALNESEPATVFTFILEPESIESYGITNKAALDALTATAAATTKFTVWGAVSVIDANSFVVDDGSGAPIKVLKANHGFSNGDYVSAAGTLDVSGAQPVLTALTAKKQN
ncbi:MAG: fibronectin type III domain-containing protein [Armatimonadota bacterium]|jgi:chitodextrinase